WLLPVAEKLAQRGAKLLVGVPVLDPDGKRYYNGAVLIGKPHRAYYKRHLVPFGEFLPFKNWLSPMLDFLHIPMSDFAPGSAGSSNIKIKDHMVGISICYEDAFGEEIRTALPTARYLINLSNDAWFGDSLAPHQHLEIARMRALETGRPLVRSTNSGISALIGPKGELQNTTTLFAKTALTGTIQPMRGITPFVHWGNLVIVILMIFGLLMGILNTKSKRRYALNHS
ncbi:acyltransferase, partial [Achromatium sp. WMS1]